MLCQGYLFSMSTIHCAIFAVTGFCRICQSSLFSQVSALGVHLDNFVSNAMPGLLVFHVHHTFSAFTVTGFCRICQLFFCLWCLPQTWELWCLSVFIFQTWQNSAGFDFSLEGKTRFVELGVSNLFSFAPSTSNLRASMLCQGYLFPMSTMLFATSEWLDSAGFAIFLFSTFLYSDLLGWTLQDFSTFYFALFLNLLCIKPAKIASQVWLWDSPGKTLLTLLNAF